MQNKFLIIGCGSIGRRHALNLRKRGGIDLLLFDVDLERVEELAAEVKGTCAESLESAFREKPCAAMICTPTATHLGFAHQALQSDCHLFIEKPISHSMDGVDALLAQSRQRGKIVMAGYSFRFDLLVRRVQALIKNERIGRVTSARLHSGSHLPWRHPWEDYRIGYAARKGLGGGVILDAVHELDLAIWLFGRPETVYCVGGTFSDLDIDVEDCAEITLAYANRVVSIHLDYVQQPASRTYEFMGTRGQIKADLFARELRIFDSGSRKWKLSAGVGTLDEMYESELEHFIGCIERGEKPEVDGTVAAESLLLAEIAKESIHAGLPLSFEEYVGERTSLRSFASV